MFAIAGELKEEFRREISNVRNDIEFLNRKLMIESEENIEFKLKIAELEARVKKLENQSMLAA